MSKIATSSIFYRRGVPNNSPQFGLLVQANYSIVQPQSVLLNFINFNGRRYRKLY